MLWSMAMSCCQAVGICGGWLEVFAVSIVVFHPVSGKNSPICSERVVNCGTLFWNDIMPIFQQSLRPVTDPPLC